MQNRDWLKDLKVLGVCAPAGQFDIEKFDKGVQIIENLGFKVFIPDGIYAQKRYLAGDDRSRAQIINTLFSNPEIDGIVCARGGFGAMRLLEYLDWDKIRSHPKPFIGFSDITALLLPFIEKAGLKVIHGPVVTSLSASDDITINSFKNILQGKPAEIDMNNVDVLIHGRAEGLFKGGNLSTISHLLGTKFQPDFKDAVLFLEDVNEPAYKIDRMLSQMKMAGLFEHIKAVITGSFEKNGHDQFLNEILAEIFEDCDIPVLTGIPAGHGKTNVSFPMGTRVEINTRGRNSGEDGKPAVRWI